MGFWVGAIHVRVLERWLVEVVATRSSGQPGDRRTLSYLKIWPTLLTGGTLSARMVLPQYQSTSAQN